MAKAVPGPSPQNALQSLQENWQQRNRQTVVVPRDATLDFHCYWSIRNAEGEAKPFFAGDLRRCSREARMWYFDTAATNMTPGSSVIRNPDCRVAEADNTGLRCTDVADIHNDETGQRPRGPDGGRKR